MSDHILKTLLQKSIQHSPKRETFPAPETQWSDSLRKKSPEFKFSYHYLLNHSPNHSPNRSRSQSPRSPRKSSEIPKPEKKPGKKTESADLDKLLEEMEGLKKQITVKKAEKVTRIESNTNRSQGLLKEQKSSRKSDMDGIMSTAASKSQWSTPGNDFLSKSPNKSLEDQIVQLSHRQKAAEIEFNSRKNLIENEIYRYQEMFSKELTSYEEDKKKWEEKVQTLKQKIARQSQSEFNEDFSHLSLQEENKRLKEIIKGYKSEEQDYLQKLQEEINSIKQRLEINEMYTQQLLEICK
ncbi:unnamed protein product [Blepharisma stoltei]|uniref:Uncharacterized protein n=1 Tax=Blepharisma stoltei TaxID=1481888 RepID=A0AAU9JPD0_9CILI|nr:unnamed protein product [Blepharisma stoltei]